VSEGARSIRPVPLTAERWAPFGWLPVADTDPIDGKHRLEFSWADPHVNIIGHDRAEVPQVAGGLRCEMLYRHDTHTQTIMSIDHRAVIVVAPAEVTFASAADADSVVAFLLEPLEPFVLHRGTWHWGPFPTTEPRVTLFNVQGLRYAEDNACVDLAQRGLALEVPLN
jgi:ureidoglycolate hydrolase